MDVTMIIIVMFKKINLLVEEIVSSLVVVMEFVKQKNIKDFALEIVLIHFVEMEFVSYPKIQLLVMLIVLRVIKILFVIYLNTLVFVMIVLTRLPENVPMKNVRAKNT
jgi:hypothetical protein